MRKKMNDQQKKAQQLALNGHSFLIVGPAGTGKSHVIKRIAESLSHNGKRVKITCSTGISCCVYKGACTIHKFLGLSDGRYDPTRLNQIHMENAKYNYVDTNLKNTDCLIVDECSMISKRLFESIISVCSRKAGGYLQLIFAGDFLQLPPVANDLYSDNGQYCFEAESFTSVFPHKVILNEPMRTSEPLLVKAITEVFQGALSPDSECFIKSLNRPLSQCQNESVKLFSNNNHVDDYNRNCILKFPGEVHEYISKDSGQISELKKVTAPHILWLKVGCPVILLQNLSDILVNGLSGIVISIKSDGPTVKFPSQNICSKIPMAKFTVFNPSIGADIAVRQQYPLRLAFSLTIHKAQGMTLERVEIDCRDIFRPGQLGVAMSRVTSSQGLRVINYHKRYVMKPPKCVTDFLMTDSVDIQDDCTCCRRDSSNTRQDVLQEEVMDPVSSPEAQSGEYHDSESVEQDFEELFLLEDEFDKVIQSVIDNETETHCFEVSDELMDNIRQCLQIDNTVTDSQKKMNEIASRLSDSDLKLFIKKVILKIQEFANTVCDKDAPITKGIPEGKINEFYKLVHEYSTGPEYKLNCMLLFEREECFSDEHMIICYKILEAVRLSCLKKRADLIKGDNSKVQQRFVTDTAKARIRYVAGYCVSKLRKKYIKKQMHNIYSKTQNGQNMYLDAKNKLVILNMLKENEQYLKETTFEPQSLMETEKKQGLTRGLTNVTDSLYNFFIQLTHKSLTVLVHENLLHFGKDMFMKCIDMINADQELSGIFNNIVHKKFAEDQFEQFDDSVFEQKSDISSLINSIYEEMTIKYFSVLFAQFRKDVKTFSKVQKKMAHRKQIKVSKRKMPLSENVDSASTKRQKSSISESSDVHSSTPQSIYSELTDGSGIQPVPGPSVSPKLNEYGADEEASSSDGDLCRKCLSEKNEDLIHCSKCNGWYHRQCAGLKNLRQWNRFSKQGVKWSCQQCQ